MPNTDTYSRPKSAIVNATGLVKNFLIGEGPNAAVAPVPDTGTDGILTTKLQADADESGGADIQTVFETTQELIINAAGEMSVQIKVYNVTGAGVSTLVQTFNVAHTESADAWQTGAGRARQA